MGEIRFTPIKFIEVSNENARQTVNTDPCLTNSKRNCFYKQTGEEIY